ncbi:MAG: hypothetical protein Q4F65_12560 [Propionibacteriaceae bacterium]|nr:hypothetical protein [Propionibacteriaceae bacterium]
MTRYRKKPVVIDAIRYQPGENCREVWDFLGWDWADHDGPCAPDDTLGIDTPEGIMTARPGDWIIRGVAGERYPCKDAIFRETYEPAGGDQ